MFILNTLLNGSAYPAAIPHGQAAVADGVIAGSFSITPKWDTDSLEPFGTHAVTGVATEAATACIGRENSTVDFGNQIVLMHPLSGGADDVVAVLQHERMGVGMPEVVEGVDFIRPAGSTVDGSKGLICGFLYPPPQEHPAPGKWTDRAITS